MNQNSRITFWYGKNQYFGKVGNPQRAINIVGTISDVDTVVGCGYRLNEFDENPFSIGPDDRRLGAKGDFNIDIDRDLLKSGENRLGVSVYDKGDKSVTEMCTIVYNSDSQWPLPWEIDWKKVARISDAVQVVDGLWTLGKDGIRTVSPWYDRMVALGDRSWRDYEIEVNVIFHSFTPPSDIAPCYGVTHAAIALRWPGHDSDTAQPHVKWYPVGASCEYTLSENLKSCRWRIICEPGLCYNSPLRSQDIILGSRYKMKARVVSEKNHCARYQAKLWLSGTAEPMGWDIEALRKDNPLLSGGALLIAHNTDVTFGNVVARRV